MYFTKYEAAFWYNKTNITSVLDIWEGENWNNLKTLLAYLTLWTGYKVITYPKIN
jgi:hypothetical protein